MNKPRVISHKVESPRTKLKVQQRFHPISHQFSLQPLYIIHPHKSLHNLLYLILHTEQLRQSSWLLHMPASIQVISI